MVGYNTPKSIPDFHKSKGELPSPNFELRQTLTQIMNHNLNTKTSAISGFNVINKFALRNMIIATTNKKSQRQKSPNDIQLAINQGALPPAQAQ